MKKSRRGAGKGSRPTAPAAALLSRPGICRQDEAGRVSLSKRRYGTRNGQLTKFYGIGDFSFFRRGE